MKTPIIVDAHQDIAYNFVNYQRDYREALSTIRSREEGTNTVEETGTATNCLPQALIGNIGLVFSTIFVNPAWGEFGRLYHTYEEAHAQALEQLAYYRELYQHPQLKQVKTRQDLAEVRATWALPSADRTVGMILLIEGADPILSPAQFSEWYEWGVRIVGLAWSKTRYSGGTVYKGIGAGGLSDDGRELLKVMRQHNAILDFSHMAEEAFNEAIEIYDGTVIASHTNPRSFRNSDRHFSDEMLRKFIAKNGVMGLVPFNYFLWDDREFAKDKQNTPLSRYLDAIDTVCQIAGSVQHVGIGSDYDGGFGRERIPQELDNVGDFPLIAEALSQRGYSDADVEAICGGNFLRVIESVLPE